MRSRYLILVIVLPLAAIGCGGGPPKNESQTGPNTNQMADDVAGMLKDYHEATRKAPTGLTDLADAEGSHPVGHAAVAAKEFIVIWRAPISASASGNVLAYHKDAPTAGGSVVMQDGSVKQMSADEFNASPKAK